MHSCSLILIRFTVVAYLVFIYCYSNEFVLFLLILSFVLGPSLCRMLVDSWHLSRRFILGKIFNLGWCSSLFQSQVIRATKQSGWEYEPLVRIFFTFDLSIWYSYLLIFNLLRANIVLQVGDMKDVVPCFPAFNLYW